MHQESSVLLYLFFVVILWVPRPGLMLSYNEIDSLPLVPFHEPNCYQQHDTSNLRFSL